MIGLAGAAVVRERRGGARGGYLALALLCVMTAGY